jgi:DNA ligase (NAD+)
MEKETAKQRLDELVKMIIMHDKLYEENRPVITDSEYDTLFLELMELEEQHPTWVHPDSPTQKIYTVIAGGLKKVKHSTPMLSQDKATTLKRIDDWKKQSPSSELVIQHKMDGLTLVLSYELGLLQRAVTRGNGEIGEDVTHNALFIANIPKSINYLGALDVRGEVVVPFSEFERINVTGQYSNPRNLASGTIRQIDSQKSAKIKMQFFAFDIANKYAIRSLRSETDLTTFLKTQGFTIAQTWHIVNGELTKIQSTLDSIQKERKQLPFMIDGAVIKFNEFKIQEELGLTSKFPKWAIAFKYQSLDATTKLISVDWQVGKSGQITPVANFNPVDIDGVIISRATFHNFQNIKNKDIRIGDTIVVARANDVIPYIQQSVKALRDGSEIEITKPMVCPACSTPLTEANRSGDSPIIKCLGVKCEPQLIGKIAHWGSRDALNIMGIGEQTVSNLFRHGIVTNIDSIYEKIQLNREVILNDIEGYGELKLANMLKAIEESKKANLSNVLYGLSIEQVGLSTAKDIAKEFGSMENIMKLLSDDITLFVTRLRSIDGIADSVTEEFLNFFGCWRERKPQRLSDDHPNVVLIRQLMSHGLTMSEPSLIVGDSLKGKTFVITGILSKPRIEIQKEIESLGGKVSGSVSKKTDYLLLGGGEEQSTKHQKAKELKVIIIDENQYKALLSQ